MKLSKQSKKRIREALAEDVGKGDVTSRTFMPRSLWGHAVIRAKGRGVVCGGAVIKEVFRLKDKRLKVTQKVQDGEWVRPGKIMFTVIGSLSSILSAERTALNFLAHLSGIATLTRRFVDKTRGTKAQILDTRKTMPLWREIEKYSVRCGGGKNHRLDLSDEGLIKNNHLVVLKCLNGKKFKKLTPQFLSARVKKFKLPLEIEVRSLTELKNFLKASIFPNRYLLDHFSIRNLEKAVLFNQTFSDHQKANFCTPLLEASGNVHLRNIRKIAKTGVDRISIGMITHSAPALDISLNIVAVS
jgi:nicotinate-nucleotide pyrophosphorylase (carboxylating)